MQSLPLQFESYLALERDDFTNAETLLLRFLTHSREEGRRREIGIALWLLAYVRLKTDREGIIEELGATSDDLTAEHRAALDAFADLARTPLPDADSARDRVLAWRRARIDSVPYFFLIDVLLDRLVRAQEYEAAAKLAARARKDSLLKQRALALFDYRLVEAAPTRACAALTR